ncbi:type IV pilus modification protein PilV [Variovorax sp. J22R24]|uniref:type IV pilus modification protein PilV n=1 Tax=Variovorax gracilis TaxID=3053502 RepID=UPI002574EA21|nr:type IV pilus modification protein PilV [Variovorax sp. J22R24]MDM0106020.1 type IV pilus modification protein PilV [Variovorax sp. J22R24]
MQRPTHPSRQGGMFLIEALVAILLFAVGILGMVGLSAYATAAQSDAEYRTLAASLAGKIAQEAWLSVDRVTGTDVASRANSLRTTLETFKHNISGTNCNFSGGASANPVVTTWATQATTTSSSWYLPGATSSMQQILVDADPVTGFNRLTVTVCWSAPSNPAKRQHVLVTYVN